MISPEDLRTMLNFVDESILQHLYQDYTDTSDAGIRSHALVLAAHVFMYVTLRQVPLRSPLVRTICTRLQNTLALTTSARETWTDHRAALLWIAFVGLLGTGQEAETSPEGQWFLSLFQSTVQRCRPDFPSNVHCIGRTLSTFLWDGHYCQPLLIWLEASKDTLAKLIPEAPDPHFPN
jgi:hypothetical protein